MRPTENNIYGISRVCGGRYPLTDQGLITAHEHQAPAAHRCAGGERGPYLKVTADGRPVTPGGALRTRTWAALIRLYHADGPIPLSDLLPVTRQPASRRQMWLETTGPRRDTVLTPRGRAWVEDNAALYRDHYPAYDLDPDVMVDIVLEAYRLEGALVADAWAACIEVLGWDAAERHVMAFAERSADLSTVRDAEAFLTRHQPART